MAEDTNGNKKKRRLYKKSGVILMAAVLGLGIFSFAQAMEMSQIRDFQVTRRWSGLQLNWKTPPLQESEGVVILKKVGDCKDFLEKGEEIYRGNGRQVMDKKLPRGAAACYGAYVYDASGQLSDVFYSGLVRYPTRGEYLMDTLSSNSNLLLGLIIIIILFWVHQKTMHLPRRRISIVRS